MAKLWSVSVCCALLFACGPDMRDGGPGDGDDGDGSGSGSGSQTEQPRQCNKMDIVFVIDDSGSMGEEQNNLKANFPKFASLLEAYTLDDGTLLDFRVALTTTGRDITVTNNIPPLPPITMMEKGDDGEFRNTCNNNKRWLDRSDASMAQTLACRAQVGTSGSSMEMPLLMSKWALAERAADTNAGFIRSDALLALVMLTDENDSSTTEPSVTISLSTPDPTNYHPPDHVQFLDTLKGNRSRWAAAAIAGDGDCSSNFGDAVNAARLKEFVDLANGNGTTQAVFSSICEGDLTKGLEEALSLFEDACGAIIL